MRRAARAGSIAWLVVWMAVVTGCGTRTSGRGPVRIGCSECPGDGGSPENPMFRFAAEVAATAAARRNLAIEWVRFSGDAEKALEKRQVDLMPRLVRYQADASVYFSAPWTAMSYCLLTRKDRNFAGPRDAGLKVGHTDNPYILHLVAKYLPQARAIPIRGRRAMVEAVCSGSVQASFFETRVLQAVLLRTRPACPETDLEVLPLPGAVVPAGVASTREAAWAADAIREEIGRMAQDGSLAALHAKWFFGAVDETKSLYESIAARQRVWTLGLTSAGLCLFLAITLWQVRQVKRAQRAAALANEAKSRFLANVSHELRTPLNGVLGLSHMLGEFDAGPAHAEVVRLIRHSAGSLVRVINDLLDFSKIEAGKLDVERIPFHLKRTVEDTAALVRPGAEEKGLTFTVVVDENIPESVAGDPGRLTQVLLNLASNAVKFTESGSITLEAIREPAGGVRFRVSDTGIGIAPEALPRLFAEFEQGDTSTTRRFGGTGLGLSISKRLVELMGGAIQLTSVPGEGSCFWFTLPLEETAGGARAAETRGSQANGEPCDVLLCEDNTVNQKVLLHLLEKLGHRVDVVGDGQDAVSAAERKRYDLILMDCYMPGLDGFGAARAIRHGGGRNRDTPIVALSAAVEAEESRWRESGMDAYLTKPLNREALLDVIGAAGAGRRPRL